VKAGSSRLRVRLLGIDPEETSFDRRGFTGADAARARLELVGRTFVRGYRAALVDDTPSRLGETLDSVEAERRGFAYEGAAMALALLDQLLLSRRHRRFAAFIAGPASAHVYMAHVCAGWAFAQLRRGPRATQGLDPLLRWLAVDGYGFHRGYFGPSRHPLEHRAPMRFSGYSLRAFDQGLGRSLWFATGGDLTRATEAIGRFPPTRRPDLWSGLGLAVAYAGRASSELLTARRSGSGACFPPRPRCGLRRRGA